MKTISLHVSEHAYDEFKSIAARQHRPVAAVIREAMTRYLDGARRSGQSVLDLEPFSCGPIDEEWDRSDIFDEMLGT